MATHLLIDSAEAVGPWRRWIGVACLCAGALALALPTVILVAQRSWSTEQGQYGMLALAIGGYMLARGLMAGPKPTVAPPLWPALVVAGLAALLYLSGRVSGEYLLETWGLYLAGLSLFLALAGLAEARRLWFPLVFLFLSLPMPSSLMVPLSSWLRQVIAAAAAGLLQFFGLAVGRDGLSLFVDNYQIDIQQACSGMNSLISVSLIGLAYIHLARRARPEYFALMCVPILLSAVVANFLRVMVIVLLTHGFGEAVGQGLLHESAGMLSFAASLLLVIALDAVIGPRFSEEVEDGRGA